MGIPMIVEKVLKDYINLFNEHLPDTIEGLYIHGSIALNAYVDDSSDIDFITLTNRRLTEEDSEALSYIHTIIANKYEKPEMDGVYAVREDSGKLNNAGKHPFYNNGELLFGDYFNFNPITWWILKSKGIKVFGPELQDFRIDIHPQELSSYVLGNMNTYWANRTQMAETSIEHLVKLPTDEIDFEIEWTVLGLLRQFYTIKEYDIVSKLDAGEYGLSHLPVEWHDIIKEAINIRKDVKEVIFSSEMERLDNTLQFSKFLINHCNNIVKSQIS
ncbi:aminoglycoside adenylyltransferase domain-containing protein [Mesobacillus selenatarsenatis]|uniref:Adenylyltransferase AadA C-terminal domain-containing protein n=1 Tax=Mesobacillus selenatarsenatis (strain DSM 18680 / JCM 14380 / FERM P-15431 / SF-1) TaxID=1321606 RepID=A0A0A8WX97_MESS1|nr:aminoglycoside adenylyltransferase domain-containing protein [Mesobacillus selenatarsenatis]GAM12248.1 unknown [Mesobacillus selenatarsenatis SF-1]